MAYGARKISPLDLKPSTAIGVAVPFSAEGVFTPVYTTKEQTKYNLINFLLTNPRERIFNPNFGAGIRSQLFEQISRDSLQDLHASIKAKLEANFPLVQVYDLRISADPNTQSVTIFFSYALKKSKEEDELTITIENV
jgi:phage baseplate assembly protein W